MNIGASTGNSSSGSPSGFRSHAPPGLEKMCSGILPGQADIAYSPVYSPGLRAKHRFDVDMSPKSLRSDKSKDSIPVLENLRKLQQDADKEEKKKHLAAMNGVSVKLNRDSKIMEEIQNEGSTTRLFLYALVRSQRFDAAIGIVILLNSITIGLESSFELAGYDTFVFVVLENIFLCVYVAELGIRFYAQRWACLRNGWVQFDVLLVGLGVLTTWIMDPVMFILKASNDGAIDNIQGAMAPIMVLRVLRLFRLARALRLLVQFKTLWMLVRGLLTSAGTICYTFLLIFVLLYVASCLVMELVTKPGRESDDEDMRRMVKDYWSNLFHIMMTLMQFVTFDGPSSIYAPMMHKNPLLVFFFVPFILVCSIALMNLVTAVIVEGALEQSKQDKDVQAEYKRAEIKKLIPKLLEMFHELDADGNGTLTLDEITDAPEDLKQQLVHFLNAENLAELFDMIDIDGSGEVNIDEFCDGISKLASSETPVEFIRILKQLGTVRQNQQHMRKQILGVMKAQQRIVERLDQLEVAHERRSREMLFRMEDMFSLVIPPGMQPKSGRVSESFSMNT